MPILTYFRYDLDNQKYVKFTGKWKIYYFGGNDCGSLYVNTIDRFKADIQRCNKMGHFLFFPSVVINQPLCFKPERRNDDGIGIIYDNVSKYKVEIN